MIDLDSSADSPSSAGSECTDSDVSLDDKLTGTEPEQDFVQAQLRQFLDADLGAALGL